MRREATDGMLALSSPPDEAYTEELPEIAELRRGDEADDVGQTDAPGGNVDLIIDATTDLSARAMTKVRKIAPDHGGGADGAADTGRGHDAEVADPQPGPHIGAHLRKARENLWLTVDDLAERTRIRPFVIECLEVDDFSPCGGDFYARGHLRMLARVLGIDPEPLIARYDDKFATAPVNARAVFDVELATGTTGMVRGGAAGANWGSLIAAVLVVVLVWGVAKFLAAEPSPAPAQATHTSNVAGLGSPGVGNGSIPSPPDARVKLTASGADSRVVVRDSAKDIVFKGVLRDGHSKKLAGEAPLRIFAANAGAIRLSVRGQHADAMGALGQAATKKITAHRSETHRPASNRTGGQPHPQ